MILQMETQSLRIRLIFDDCSVLSPVQRSQGMNHSWILIEQNQLPMISDVCSHLLHKFNIRSSCPNGILLFMEGFVLPPSESTRILKDNDIVCVKRKAVALAEALEGAVAGNMLNAEVNRREHVDNGMLLLANEEFDKETGGYQSESEDAEVEKPKGDTSPKQTASKKRKASIKLRSTKKKKHRLVVIDGVEDEVARKDNNINKTESLPVKIIHKKSKPNKEKKRGETETMIEKVTSPSKVKRKKKHRLEEFIGDEDEVETGELEDVNDGESVIKKKISKKKAAPNPETEKVNAEASDEDRKDGVEGVKQTSTTLDVGQRKAPSRSTRRKKAKRKWRLEELAKKSQNPESLVVPEISKTENKEATGYQEGPDKEVTKVTHKEITEQEGRNHIENGITKLVPCVIRPGHIRFEPLDEDEDAKQTEAPDVAFEWNGITSKKKGQKWGLEKFSTSKRNDSQKAATEEPSEMLTVEAQVQLPLVDLNTFDQLPLYSSPKEGDVIAYRVVELSSSWTPELSSFRVGKISNYDADNIVLMPVPEYPIVFDEMDENGPENSLYKEDGSLEIKFAELSDVRSLNQSNGVSQTAEVDKTNAASNLISNGNNNHQSLSKDPTPVALNNAWDEIKELLSAKKSELLETNEEDMKRDSGRNKWSYRALRGSALGPTMSLLRSKNDI